MPTASERAEKLDRERESPYDHITHDALVDEINAALRERDLQWSKALGFSSAELGKAQTPEEAAEFIKDAKSIFKRASAEATTRRIREAVEVKVKEAEKENDIAGELAFRDVLALLDEKD